MAENGSESPSLDEEEEEELARRMGWTDDIASSPTKAASSSAPSSSSKHKGRRGSPSSPISPRSPRSPLVSSSPPPPPPSSEPVTTKKRTSGNSNNNNNSNRQQQQKAAPEEESAAEEADREESLPLTPKGAGSSAPKSKHHHRSGASGATSSDGAVHATTTSNTATVTTSANDGSGSGSSSSSTPAPAEGSGSGSKSKDRAKTKRKPSSTKDASPAPPESGRKEKSSTSSLSIDINATASSSGSSSSSKKAVDASLDDDGSIAPSPTGTKKSRAKHSKHLSPTPRLRITTPTSTNGISDLEYSDQETVITTDDMGENIEGLSPGVFDSEDNDEVYVNPLALQAWSIMKDAASNSETTVQNPLITLQITTEDAGSEENVILNPLSALALGSTTELTEDPSDSFKGKCVVYTVPGSRYTPKALDILTQFGIPYYIVHVYGDDAKAKLRERSGRRLLRFPEIYFNDVYIGGQEDLFRLYVSKELSHHIIALRTNEMPLTEIFFLENIKMLSAEHKRLHGDDESPQQPTSPSATRAKRSSTIRELFGSWKGVRKVRSSIDIGSLERSGRSSESSDTLDSESPPGSNQAQVTRSASIQY